MDVQAWNDQNVELTLEGKLAEPCVGFVSIPVGHLAPGKPPYQTILCTKSSHPSRTPGLWSWESHPLLLPHHWKLNSRNFLEFICFVNSNQFKLENSLLEQIKIGIKCLKGFLSPGSSLCRCYSRVPCFFSSFPFSTISKTSQVSSNIFMTTRCVHQSK